MLLEKSYQPIRGKEIRTSVRGNKLATGLNDENPYQSIADDIGLTPNQFPESFFINFIK